MAARMNFILGGIKHLVPMVLALLVFVQKSQSQRASARIEPDTILIGHHSTLYFEVEALKGDFVALPNFTDSTYKAIEFFEIGVDTILKESNGMSLSFTIPFTSWTPGLFEFDPLPFAILRGADTLRIFSNKITLLVNTVKVADDGEIYDIKPIKKMPASLREILTYFIPLVLLLGLIVWLAYRHFFRKKKETSEDIWENQAIPAHIAAISSLEKLRSQKLWQAGKVKQYHSELTFIVRMFIEKRFSVPALEMTTLEICKSLPPHLESIESINVLKPALEVADLVKFAKYQPLPEENEMSLHQAIEFVKANIQTLPEQEKVQKGKVREKPSYQND